MRCGAIQTSGQLFVAIQCTAVSFKQGATFRCHSMCCGVIQTRGNFPLPFNVLRCRPNKGQLSVAIQYAAVPSKQGATFRCHSMRCGAILTRGNFPLPFKTPRCHFKQGATFRCHAVSFRQGAIFHCHRSEVAHLESRFRAR